MDRLIASRQSLGEALRSASIVPVLGPNAIEVEVDGHVVPFYRLVVDELLRTFGATLPAGMDARDDTWVLYRAVDHVLATQPGLSTERVRRSVSAIINSLAPSVQATPLLERLAALRAFDLYICLTPDDLLVNALARALGSEAVAATTYAPNLDSSQPVDIVSARAGLAQVYFPLGRCAASSRVAIHEEDAFEHLYRFQEEGARRAPRLLATLHSCDLLLLGCSLPDWLGRAFLRLANESRFSAQDKKMEFFAADARDPALNSFLARFDPNATVFPWSVAEFIDELEQLAVPRSLAPVPPDLVHAAGMQRAGPTVFVSYASEDKDAARRIADALVAAGFADVWLDQRKLRAGDDWSDRIDEAIEHCDFFLPVLSRQADRRRVGVFWEEWRKAIARALRVHDTFLLPVGIDATPPAQSDYERIFSGYTAELRRLHLIHAPDGHLPADILADLAQRADSLAGGRGG